MSNSIKKRPTKKPSSTLTKKGQSDKANSRQIKKASNDIGSKLNLRIFKC